MTDYEIQKFFSRSSHISVATLGRIRSDICDIAHTLQLSIRVATWGETSQSKLCVYGGLPFSVYNERDYIIPVQIWLSSQYPLEPPTVYVVPTGSEKILSNCRFVDPTGLCYTPALAEWSPANSSLKGIVVQLVKLFCLQPPLWTDDLPSSPQASESAVGVNAASQSAGTPLSSTNTSTVREEGSCADDGTCVICLTAPKDSVLVPCGHFCCCGSCASNLRKCPICRVNIQFRQKVFL